MINHHRHSRLRNRHHELFRPSVLIRKLFKISAKSSDYSADSDDQDSPCNSDGEEESWKWPRSSRFKEKNEDDFQNEASSRSRRRKSETFRAQYIDAKELRVSVNTWNVGGKLPPEDLDIDDWLETDNPADIYVIGFQEIIPLNAGFIFGAEDKRPIPIWENIIRETLNNVQPVRTNVKCFSDPPSPSRFKPSHDTLDIENEVVLESDSEGEFEASRLKEEFDFEDVNMPAESDLKMQLSATKRMERLNCLQTEDSEENEEESPLMNRRKLTKLLSGKETIGISWPEQPLDLMAQCVSERPNAFESVKSFNHTKSLRTYSSFKSYMNIGNRVVPEAALVAELDPDSFMYRRKVPQYVRIASKQMVGIFLTIWVRRSLRKHIQNVHVSTVGVGVMGFIGNKGSVSVSMSIYQTLFCFVCTHLASGERDADKVKRNADVHEIHKRTRFNSPSNTALPKSIADHERIIWLGDLNYRINLSYEKTHDLISKNDWPELFENDQLGRELRKGRAFDGWTEGELNFPPTYKYEPNSEIYTREEPKVGRRTPAWCDRILSFGKGIRQFSYRRSDIRLSDHRPVNASYMIEVEVFSPRKLQRALTFTDAEIENDGIIAEMRHDA